MITFLTVSRLALTEYLAYRLNFFLEILGNLVFLGVSLIIWLFIFNQQGGMALDGYTKPELITYFLGAAALASFLLFAGQGDEVDRDIMEGRLSLRLTQPLSVLGYWLTRDSVRKIILFLISIIGIGLVAMVINEPLTSLSTSNIGLAFAALIIAFLLHGALFMIFALLAFWFEYAWGFRFLMRTIVELAAGVFVPLSLFPSVVSEVFHALPFQYLANFPLELMLGHINQNDIIPQFITALTWLIITGALLLLVWRKGLKSYTAVGN